MLVTSSDENHWSLYKPHLHPTQSVHGSLCSDQFSTSNEFALLPFYASKIPTIASSLQPFVCLIKSKLTWQVHNQSSEFWDMWHQFQFFLIIFLWQGYETHQTKHFLRLCTWWVFVGNQNTRATEDIGCLWGETGSCNKSWTWWCLLL